MGILELLQHIVDGPAPQLTPEDRYPKEAQDPLDSCLFKDPDERKNPKDLLVCCFSRQVMTGTQTRTYSNMNRY